MQYNELGSESSTRKPLNKASWKVKCLQPSIKVLKKEEKNDIIIELSFLYLFVNQATLLCCLFWWIINNSNYLYLSNYSDLCTSWKIIQIINSKHKRKCSSGTVVFCNFSKCTDAAIHKRHCDSKVHIKVVPGKNAKLR